MSWHIKDIAVHSWYILLVRSNFPTLLSVGKAIKARLRLQEEIIPGDFIDSTERIRHGLYRSDKTPASDEDSR